MAKTFDGPPSIERSGSEHREGAVTSFLLRRKAWLEVELPLAKGRRRDSKKITSIFLGKPLSFSIQKDFQSPSAPHVSYPSPKD